MREVRSVRGKGWIFSLFFHCSFIVVFILAARFGHFGSAPLLLPKNPSYDMPLDVQLADISSAPISKPKAPETKELVVEPEPEKKSEETLEKKDQGTVEEIPLSPEESTPKPKTPVSPEPPEKEEKSPPDVSQEAADAVTKALVKPSPQVKKIKEKPSAEVQKKRNKKRNTEIEKLLKKKLAAEAKNAQKIKAYKEHQRQLLNLLNQKSGGASETLETDENSSSEIGAETIGPLAAGIWDRIRTLLERRFHVPSYLRSAQPVIVEVYLIMNPNGTLAQYRVNSKGSTVGHPLYQQFLLYVQRVLEPLHNEPLPLPQDRYDQWKSFTFVFDNT